MANKSYDAIVIGGGPGGYPAAIRLGQLGLKALVVEKEYMGGICLNWGCIPSKALIYAAGLADKIRRAGDIGLKTGDLQIDIDKMQDWKEGIVKKLTGGVRSLVKSGGGEIVMGTGTVKDGKTVEVQKSDGSKETYEAKKGIICATGTEVIQLPGFEPDGKNIITAREAVDMREIPESMLLIGGGIIGLELGMVYQKLGTKVTVVELTDQLLPGVDKDMVKVVEKHVKKAGGEILLEAKAKSVERKNGKLQVRVDHKQSNRTLEVDKILVAVGFKPNAAALGLDKVGVKTDAKGHIEVNDQFQTSVAGVYAIGDVIGPPYLAHKATKEGEIAAEVIAGHKSARDWRGMPAAIFTDPEVATVGLSETEAKQQGRKIKVGKFPFAASGRAMAVMETDGFVKTIIDADSHEVLGVGIVGPDASDLISEAALAMEMCAFSEDVALTIHPHPTLSESVMESFKNALGEAIHIANR